MLRIKRRVNLALNLVLLTVVAMLLMTPLTVRADTYTHSLSIEVWNNSSTVYSDGVPLLVVLNNTQFYQLGYINSTGLDTDFQEGATGRDFMVTEGYLGIFAPSFAAYQTRNYAYRLSNEPGNTSHPIITGVGGSVTADDSGTIEPVANDFTVLWDGYVDTSALGAIIEKIGAYGLVVDIAGNVTAYCIDSSPSYAYLYPVGAGDFTDITTVSGAATHWQAVDDPQGTPDDATTYVAGGSTDQQKDEYLLTDSAVPSGSYISEVRVYFRQHGISGPPIYKSSAQPFLELNGELTTGTEIEDSSDAWATYSEVLTRPGGGAWTPEDFDDLRLQMGLKNEIIASSYLTQAYVRVSYQVHDGVSVNVASGFYSLNMTKTGASLELFVNTVSQGTETVSNPDNNGNGLVIDGDTATVTDRAQIYISGKDLDYHPITMMSSTVVDYSGNGNYGTINWGSNPSGSGFVITIGGLIPYSDYIPPGGSGNETVPEIYDPVEDYPFWGNSTETGSNLPMYNMIKESADSMGWTTNTLYGFLMLIPAIALGTLVGLGTKSMLFGGFTVVLVLFIAAATTIIPWWLPVSLLIMMVFVIYISRRL